MPLPQSDYASLIEPTRLTIISPMLHNSLSLWERARVRGAGWHNDNFASFVKSGRVQRTK
ncbi:hypothetical protein WP9W18E04_39760 [Aeromonas veronii]|nr:hypothetical protein WP9W18E04_39760 [Aeromonas veronii]